MKSTLMTAVEIPWEPIPPRQILCDEYKHVLFYLDEIYLCTLMYLKKYKYVYLEIYVHIGW